MRTESDADHLRIDPALRLAIGKNCFHPLFCFTSEGACPGSKLRPGNVHSADGTLDFIKPIVERCRSWFQLFWLRGAAAFADPDLYEYCEANRITYFIRLRGNQVLYDMIEPYLTRPVGRPPKSGVQVRFFHFHYQAQSWSRQRRVVCKIEWHSGELFPRVGFIATNSRLTSEAVVKVYNGRSEVENRIEEGKNTLRRDQTGCHRFDANHARLKRGVPAYNLLHMIRVFYLYGEEVRRSIEWLIRRLTEVGAKSVGAREVDLIEGPMAAAIGAGLRIAETSGNMIVDRGGGTTEVAVIALNDIVFSQSARIAGDKTDESIIRFIKRKYNFLIGDQSAEKIKIGIGTAPPGGEIKRMMVKGRDLVAGIPKSIELNSGEILEAVSEPIYAIVETVRITLERTPPEPTSDIVDKGIVLAGGGALLRDIDILLREETGLPVMLAEDPLTCMAIGAGKALDEEGLLREIENI